MTHFTRRRLSGGILIGTGAAIVTLGRWEQRPRGWVYVEGHWN
jgi:WXXGXW repeat (2 copies)